MQNKSNNLKTNLCTFKDWANEINPNALSLWSEAMTQLRQTHSDVWNGVRFFLTVNSIILAAIFALIQNNASAPKTIGVIISALAVIGLALTIAALRILRGHREYYLGILVRKTLLEKELGFYDVNLYGADLSFPWRVEPEHLEEILKDPAKWQKQQVWRGKITPLLRYAYLMIIVIYVGILTIVVLSFFMRVV